MVVDFRDGEPRALWNNPRMLRKGFIRNSHDVLEFNYERELMRHGVWRTKWSPKLCKKRTDDHLVQFARHYQPDMVMVNFKPLNGTTVQRLRAELPGAVFVIRYGDMCEGLDARVLDVAKACDWMMATSAGPTLQKYKDAGVPHCAFIPNPCDEDLEYRMDVPPSCKSDLLFTGKINHHLEGQDSQREELIHHLVQKRNMTVWGCLGRPAVEGREYLQAICGTKIALSINAFNDIRCYHSDRLTHYLACGAFVLAKYVPGSERLFADRKHLCYFHTTEECLSLVDYYLTHEEERLQIAQQGYEHIHANFSGQALARHIIDLVQTGRYDAPWGDIS